MLLLVSCKRTWYQRIFFFLQSFVFESCALETPQIVQWITKSMAIIMIGI